MKLRLLALSLITTSLLSTSVMAQRVETVSEGVYTTLERGDSLDVVSELNLRSRLAKGDKLLSVKVKVSKTMMRSKLRVLLNGELLAKYNLSDRIPQLEIDLTGKDVSSLQLKSRGAYIEKLTAQIQKKRVVTPPRGGNGNLQVVKARIDRYLGDGSVLPVRKTLKQHTGDNLKGKVVKKIVLKGYSINRYNKAYAQLVVNGMDVGDLKAVPVESYRSGVVAKVVFPMPRIGQGVVGRDIRNIKIKVYGGDMMAQVLKAKVKAGRGTVNRDVVRVNVNRSFTGYSASILSQLLDNASRRIDFTRPIESITFETSGRGSIRVDAARRIQADYRARVGTRRVDLLGDVTVDEVRVVMNGNVSIHSVQIKYGRSYEL